MSDHGHAASSEGHADHHDEYLGVPADEAGPGEPSTPGWLTLLGMGLVLVTMLGFVVSRPDGKTRAELAPAGSASAAAAPTPAAAPAPNPDGARPGRPTLDMARPADTAAMGGSIKLRPIPGGTPQPPKPGRPGQFAVGPGGSAAAPRPVPAGSAR